MYVKTEKEPISRFGELTLKYQSCYKCHRICDIRKSLLRIMLCIAKNSPALGPVAENAACFAYLLAGFVTRTLAQTWMSSYAMQQRSCRRRRILTRKEAILIHAMHISTWLSYGFYQKKCIIKRSNFLRGFVNRNLTFSPILLEAHIVPDLDCFSTPTFAPTKQP